jgi:phage repressor protein C with HTH and peptisase S24 domain
MSETVHRSSMECTDPNPEKRRDIVSKGYNPSFDP